MCPDYKIIYFRQKNKEQRENVIGELVTTEREYCRDLKLTWQAFSLDDPDVLEQKQIDVKGRDFEKEKSVKSRQRSCLEIHTAMKILEILGIQTSSSFVKI